MPEQGGSEPTTAIPAQREPGNLGDDDSAEETRAIPTARKSDADAATEKLNTRPADGQPPRRGGSGRRAQHLLRRGGRLK